MTKKLRRGLAALLLPALWFCAGASARAEAASGVVLDRVNTREVPVDRVQVKLCADPARTRCRSTLTQRDGQFYLEAPPGTYIFVGELPNGAVFTTRVTIAAGRPNYFKIYLPK
ncbi:MAG TPA: hypothetical protein VIF14_02175 [Alphaproteobacteria bacterium]|jgi:hypothetical protein